MDDFCMTAICEKHPYGRSWLRGVSLFDVSHHILRILCEAFELSAETNCGCRAPSAFNKRLFKTRQSFGKKLHEPTNLIFASLPVFRRKCVTCNMCYTARKKSLENSFKIIKTCFMSAQC